MIYSSTRPPQPRRPRQRRRRRRRRKSSMHSTDSVAAQVVDHDHHQHKLLFLAGAALCLLIGGGSDHQIKYVAYAEETSMYNGNNRYSNNNYVDYNSNSNNQQINSNGLPKGWLDVQTFCPDAPVQVEEMILTCDSPGAYYYGSSTYRNSKVCMSNDRATLQMYFTISGNYQGSSVLVTLQSGLYDSFITVVDSYNLCQLGVSGDNAYRCPKPGEYWLKMYYYVPQIRDYSFHYTPDIKMIFRDGETQRRIGCVSTGTAALHKRADRKAARGLLALGVATSVFVVVFGLLIYLSYKRKKQIECQRESAARSRFNYFRTLPSGQAVQLPGGGVAAGIGGGRSTAGSIGGRSGRYHHQQGLTTVHSASTDEASTSTGVGPMNITNPSYNTPQVPTRPII